jgi:hypothetical protein
LPFSQLWINWCFNACRGRVVLGGLCMGALFFTAGGIIAVTAGFLSLYVTSLPIYLGAFGIAWVSAWCAWAGRRVPDILQLLRPAIALTDAEFADFAHAWLRRFHHNRLFAVISALLFSVSALFVVWQIYGGGLPWFPADWSLAPARAAKAAILCIFSVGIAALLVTTTAGILNYAAFTKAVSQQPLVPVLDFVRLRFRPMTTFAVMTALAWSVGVALFAVLFSAAFGPGGFSVIVFLTLLGVIMIAVPQVYLHWALERLQDDVVLAGWSTLGSGRHVVDPVTVFMERDRREIYNALVTTAQSRTWVHNPLDFFMLVGTWLIPLVVLLIDRALRASVSSP